MANETEYIENLYDPKHEDDAVLNTRAYNVLKREDVHTISDLEKMCPCDVRKLRSLGVSTLRNIEAALKAYNGHDLAPCLHWGDCPVCHVTITRGMIKDGLISHSSGYPSDRYYAHTACLKNWERTRRAAQYIIGDQIETALLNGEDFSHEAKEWNVYLDDLLIELQRQASLMTSQGLKDKVES